MQTGGIGSWGGPEVTGQAAGRRLAESAPIGQQLIAWQRWGRAPSYPKAKGVDAAAIGIVELAEVRPRARDGSTWRLKIVEKFATPVPLLSYRAAEPEIDEAFRMARATFQALTASQERAVRRICGLPRVPATEQELGPIAGTSNGRGAGFGDPESNRRVEVAAIDEVKRQLREDGWKVTTVERHRIGYDLKARRGRAERHVEVKGVKGVRPDFIVTANEVRVAATDSAWELWVVTSALSPNPKVRIVPGVDFRSAYRLDVIAYRAHGVG